MTYIIDFKASQCSTQCIGQSQKELRKILRGWLQKHRLPTRFCLAFLVRYKTFQATHNVGLFPPRRYKIRNVGQFPPRRCISDVRLFPPRSCNVRPFPPGRHRDASSREEAASSLEEPRVTPQFKFKHTYNIMYHS